MNLPYIYPIHTDIPSHPINIPFRSSPASVMANCELLSITVSSTVGWLVSIPPIFDFIDNNQHHHCFHFTNLCHSILTHLFGNGYLLQCNSQQLKERRGMHCVLQGNHREGLDEIVQAYGTSRRWGASIESIEKLG